MFWTNSIENLTMFCNLKKCTVFFSVNSSSYKRSVYIHLISLLEIIFANDDDVGHDFVKSDRQTLIWTGRIQKLPVQGQAGIFQLEQHCVSHL